MNRLRKYPAIVNSQDLLKCAGIILITLDHVSTYVTYVPVFSILGNAGAPVFFFLAGLHVPKRIFWEYLVFGVVITLITRATLNIWFGNILLSFFLIKLVLYYFPRLFTSIWGGLLAIVPMFMQPFNFVNFGSTFFEYGGFGLSYAFSSQVRRHKVVFGTLALLVVLTCHYTWMHVFDRSAYMLPFDYGGLRFHFLRPIDFWYVVLFYVVYVATALAFMLYRMREYRVPEPIKMPILFMSRYSLHLYAAQMILFGIFSRPH